MELDIKGKDIKGMDIRRVDIKGLGIRGVDIRGVGQVENWSKVMNGNLKKLLSE